ncbi:MAG: hypothetical protein ACREEQ_07970, partial [Caulobacteraceae bacterium]
RQTSPLYVERPVGEGIAVEFAPRPIMATVGLRLAPAPEGSGVRFQLDVPFGALPAGFFKAVEAGVREALLQGLSGWPVTDCLVAMTHVLRYRDFPASTPADHRNLARLVVMAALRQAGAVVCEPMERFHLDCPIRALEPVLSLLGVLRAAPEPPTLRGEEAVVEGEIQAVRSSELLRRLPALTHGEGALERALSRHRALRPPYPTRARLGPNPLNRREYLASVPRSR